jgi:hypothetical protein
MITGAFGLQRSKSAAKNVGRERGAKEADNQSYLLGVVVVFFLQASSKKSMLQKATHSPSLTD